MIRPSFHYDDSHDEDLVVAPSFSFDARELSKVDGVNHYEERMMCSLFSLRYPGTRVVYCSSTPLSQGVLDYYKSLLPDVNFDNRLLLITCNDSSNVSLASKLLERPRLLQRIKDFIRPGKSFLTCFTGTELEIELANQLDVTYFSASKECARYGTKAGSREIFQQCNIPHPIGVDETYEIHDLACKISHLLRTETTLQKMVVKLNTGFSGEGNAILDLHSIESIERKKLDETILTHRVLDLFEDMKFCAPNETWYGFSKQIRRLGVIAEAFIESDPSCTTSPSAQIVVLGPDEVEVISTHEQILDGQVYKGCSFPCKAKYRLQIMEMSRKIGIELSHKGMLDHFGVDFLVVEDKFDATKINIQAIEINLRRGGTTHPQLTTRCLVNGSLSLEDGLMRNEQDIEKYYIGFDNISSSAYRGLMASDLVDIMKESKLAYSHDKQEGVVFHMLGCLSQYGKIGVTCIANTTELAEKMLVETEVLLTKEAMRYPKCTLVTPIIQSSVFDHQFVHSSTLDGEQRKKLSDSQKMAFELDALGITSFTIGAPTEIAKIRMLILVCTHGNETCGLRAVNDMLSKGELQAWAKSCMAKSSQLRILIANPQATLKRTRFIDTNLNRLLPNGVLDKTMKELEDEHGYEGKMAYVIAQAISKCTHMLDIHSTSSHSPVHLFPGRTPGSKELVEKCPGDFSVSEICYFTMRPGTTVSFADSLGIICVGSEMGQHDANSSVIASEKLVKSFISGVHDLPIIDPKFAPPLPLKCVGAQKVKPGFQFNGLITPFQFVKKGDLLATDEDGDIKLNYDAFIVMPTLMPIVGEEAFFIAVPIDTVL